MRAEPTDVLKFIGGGSTQFFIPCYQRMYSWEIEHCKKLWEDIVNIGSNDKAYAHFMGSVMYISDSYSQSSINKLCVIDGQQRITTITLLLIALSESIGDQSFLDQKFTRTKIIERYLTNTHEDGDKKFRLILSQIDKDTLLALIDKDKLRPKDPSARIMENFIFFKKQLEVNKDKMEIVCRGINKLCVIDISLDREKDDAQRIFESMNSTGKTLNQTDLIRNYILMNLPQKEQEEFYEKYWRVIETNFNQNNHEKKFDLFVRHFLTIRKDGETPNINKIYESFKEYKERQNINAKSLLEELKKYCNYYCNIAFKKEQDKELLEAFEELLQLEAEVIYPFLLTLYDDYEKGILKKKDFIDIIKIIRSYIFRRAVCEVPTNALNKTFATFSKKINKQNYLESVLVHLCILEFSQRFPNDEEFKQKLISRDLYHSFNKKQYLLDSLENFEQKENINTKSYTIEHIMPQNIKNSKEWQKELGENWQEIHEKYLHTLGNLTLTGYNTEYSNKPFKEKRDCRGGFKESPIRLNSMLKNIENFNEKSINQRASQLADKALQIWQYPKFPRETLEKYKLKQESNPNQYHFLRSGGKSRSLFDRLHQEILNLDENITERYLKHYIVYSKFNFDIVFVEPMAKSLKLFINSDTYRLTDPKNLLRDVSNVGHWGSGNTEIVLKSPDDINYCLDIIMQVIEKQEQ